MAVEEVKQMISGELPGTTRQLMKSVTVADERWARIRRAWPVAPALLLLLFFFLAPTLYVARSSILDPGFSLAHYARFFDRPIYIDILLRTVQVSVVVAAICTAIGYPVAHYISQQPRKLQLEVAPIV